MAVVISDVGGGVAERAMGPLGKGKGEAVAAELAEWLAEHVAAADADAKPPHLLAGGDRGGVAGAHAAARAKASGGGQGLHHPPTRCGSATPAAPSKEEGEQESETPYAYWSPPPEPKFNPLRQVRFLDALARCGDVRASADAAGVSAMTAYRLRRRDAAFAHAWAAALVLARDAAEQTLASRALDGVREPIFFQGKQVGYRTRYDSRLLLAYLARLDRAAQDEAVGTCAARFDEVLAAIGGVEGAALEIEPRIDYGDQESQIARDNAGPLGPMRPVFPVEHRAEYIATAAGLGAAVDEEARDEAAEEWDAYFEELTDGVDEILAMPPSTLGGEGEGEAAAAEEPAPEYKSRFAPDVAVTGVTSASAARLRRQEPRPSRTALRALDSGLRRKSPTPPPVIPGERRGPCPARVPAQAGTSVGYPQHRTQPPKAPAFAGAHRA